MFCGAWVVVALETALAADVRHGVEKREDAHREAQDEEDGGEGDAVVCTLRRGLLL